MVRTLDIILGSLAVVVIRGYQLFLSPLKGYSCAHRLRHGGESCSEYARSVFAAEGMRVGIKTLKGECIRVETPLSPEDARRLVAEFVTRYNTVRLHSAIGYVTPADKLAGRAEAVWAARRQKLATAGARRRAKSQGKGFAEPRPPELQ